MSTAPRYQTYYLISDYLQWEGSWELWNGTAVAMSPSLLGPHGRKAVSERIVGTGFRNLVASGE